MEALRGAAQVAFLCNRHEIFDLREAHGNREFNTLEAPAVIPNRYGTFPEHGCMLAAMPIEILSREQHHRLRRASAIAAATLAWVGRQLRPGISTAQIDQWVRLDTQRRGAAPSQLGYQGFPAAVCTSRNHVVCHGIPNPDECLEPGDIINIDVTSAVDGFHGDTSATFIIGDASAEIRHLVEVARRARDVGIAVVREGVRLGEIGRAIEDFVRREGCSVVRELGGHGIGRRMHMDPHVPHHAASERGPRLRAGMALTIEPMVNLGGPEVLHLEDGWTVITADGSWSAQFEHTVLVTPHGAEILSIAD
jgi:methionyl aminopeptidase